MNDTPTIPCTVFGTDGPPLVFLHANGIPPACYRPLLTALGQDFRVLAMHLRPLWPGADPHAVRDWRILADDLGAFLAQQGFAGPVYAAGHSVGATTVLRAALRWPERFAGIALLDPVLFPPLFSPLFAILRTLGLLDLIPTIRAARRRRVRFDDPDRLFHDYRRKAVFRYLSDEALRAYIHGILCRDGQGWRLCQSREWELAIYRAGIWRDGDIWQRLSGLQVPAIALRGAETDAFPRLTVRRLRRRQPALRVITFPQATHLLPLEHPAAVAAQVRALRPLTPAG